MDEMRAQAERFGAELVADDIVEVDLTGEIKVVKTATDTYTARSVILADRLGLPQARAPNEEELSGRGSRGARRVTASSSASSTSPWSGGGDSAIEEATFLTRFGSKVT
jgi:thioredoxin reductase (NADPH)